MENTDELLVPNNIVFCEKRWKIAAVLLGVLTFSTFAWGLIILGSFLGDHDFSEYSINSLNGGMNSWIHTANGNPQMQQLASPAVVNVLTVGPQGQSTTTSSGVIIHPEGYVLSNLHSIKSSSNVVIQLQTSNGSKRYDVEIIKTNPQHDLVLLKIVTKDRFLFLKLADTQTLKTGIPVMSIGRDASGVTVATSGILRQQDRQISVGNLTMTHLLQSDAPALWQQSGGPMINNKAELVGINVVISSKNGMQGYAIPAHVIKAHFQDIIRFTSNNPQQNNANGQQNTAAQPSGSLGKLAASWWGRARDLQLQDQKIATAANPVHSNPNKNMGVNIAAQVDSITATPTPPATTAVTPPAVQAQAEPVTPNVAHIGSAGDMVTLIDLEHETGFKIGGYKLDAMFGLALLGLLGGIIGALMPMGGSLVVVTGMMMFFGYGLYLIRPVIYVSNLFTYGIPAFRFMQKGLVMRDHLRPLFTWIVAGVLIGYFIGHNMVDHFVGYLLGLFALVMAYISLQDIHESKDDSSTVTATKAKNNSEELDAFLDNVNIEKEDEKDNMLQTAIMGAPLGFLTGILGVSGGLLEIFYQRRVAGVSSSNALANASVMVFVASLTAAIVSFLYGTSVGAFSWQTPLTLAMIIVPSAFAGGILGHRLCERITLHQQRYSFAGIMIMIAIMMLFAQ